MYSSMKEDVLVTVVKKIGGRGSGAQRGVRMFASVQKRKVSPMHVRI